MGISEPNLNHLQWTGAATLFGGLWKWEGSAACTMGGDAGLITFPVTWLGLDILSK